MLRHACALHLWGMEDAVFANTVPTYLLHLMGRTAGATVATTHSKATQHIHISVKLTSDKSTLHEVHPPQHVLLERIPPSPNETHPLGTCCRREPPVHSILD